MNEVVNQIEKRNFIMNQLLSLFEQGDRACRDAGRFFYGTNKECCVYDLNNLVHVENIIGQYEMALFEESEAKEYNKDSEWYKLKADFDFSEYIVEKNGPYTDHGNYIMFDTCGICGHHNDLVYYPKTKTFFCFSANGRIGGSVIDYLMGSEKLSQKEATHKFKYELCGVNEETDKRDYAIRQNVECDDRLQEIFSSLDPVNYSWDDSGLGRLFAEVYKDKCRYNSSSGCWYVYDGKVWIKDSRSLIVSEYAKTLYDNLRIYATGIEDEELKEKYIKFINKLGTLNKRKAMIEDARGKYPVDYSTFDKDPYLFNCQNGTIDLNDVDIIGIVLRPHDPNDYLTKISNAYYDEKADSRTFNKFIDEVMVSDKDKIEYIKKAIGLSLTGDTSLETCFILHGATTRNGKSTLVETLAYMLGDYAMAMVPETLALRRNKDSKAPSGDIARLRGCRFLNASEPPSNMRFDVALLKTLLGRDAIVARHLHESEFQFIPEFKLFMNTNHLPTVGDDTLFTSGRINIISFDRHFETHEQDKTLKDKLRTKESVSGILNWCLEGLSLFQSNGLEPPDSVKLATKEYQRDNDKVGRFIEECLIDSNKHSQGKDVYMAYHQWCFDSGLKPESKTRFFRILRDRSILSDSGKIEGKARRNVVRYKTLIAEYSMIL